MSFRPKFFIFEYLLALVATVGLMRLLDMIPGLRPGISVALVLPLLIAAMLEGRSYARAFKKRPDPRVCWGVALAMAVLLGALVVAPGLFAAAIYYNSSVLTPQSLLLIAMVVPLLRIGYGIGIASEMKGLHRTPQ